ncbi:putative uncharacterized protein DDB_G0282133 [Mya arenaria]|uniref:putative uncharacterized protein DDB_G0282133 n=1 Tax=Mya arenaria TaxID=6604 RepID=UPI0022E32709|nr:putative uncharacterized protein DDB_G0282133 [Mya arenaria]
MSSEKDISDKLNSGELNSLAEILKVCRDGGVQTSSDKSNSPKSEKLIDEHNKENVDKRKLHRSDQFDEESVQFRRRRKRSAKLKRKSLADVIVVCRANGKQIFNDVANVPESDKAKVEELKRAGLDFTDPKRHYVDGKHRVRSKTSTNSSIISTPVNSRTPQMGTNFKDAHDLNSDNNAKLAETGQLQQNQNSKVYEMQTSSKGVSSEEWMQMRLRRRSRRNQSTKLALEEVINQDRNNLANSGGSSMATSFEIDGSPNLSEEIQNNQQSSPTKEAMDNGNQNIKETSGKQRLSRPSSEKAINESKGNSNSPNAKMEAESVKRNHAMEGTTMESKGNSNSPNAKMEAESVKRNHAMEGTTMESKGNSNSPNAKMEAESGKRNHAMEGTTMESKGNSNSPNAKMEAESVKRNHAMEGTTMESKGNSNSPNAKMEAESGKRNHAMEGTTMESKTEINGKRTALENTTDTNDVTNNKLQVQTPIIEENSEDSANKMKADTTQNGDTTVSSLTYIEPPDKHEYLDVDDLLKSENICILDENTNQIPKSKQDADEGHTLHNGTVANDVEKNKNESQNENLVIEKLTLTEGKSTLVLYNVRPKTANDIEEKEKDNEPKKAQDDNSNVAHEEINNEAPLYIESVANIKTCDTPVTNKIMIDARPAVDTLDISVSPCLEEKSKKEQISENENVDEKNGKKERKFLNISDEKGVIEEVLGSNADRNTADNCESTISGHGDEAKSPNSNTEDNKVNKIIHSPKMANSAAKNPVDENERMSSTDIIGESENTKTLLSLNNSPFRQSPDRITNDSEKSSNSSYRADDQSTTSRDRSINSKGTMDRRNDTKTPKSLLVSVQDKTDSIADVKKCTNQKQLLETGLNMNGSKDLKGTSPDRHILRQRRDTLDSNSLKSVSICVGEDKNSKKSTPTKQHTLHEYIKIRKHGKDGSRTNSTSSSLKSELQGLSPEARTVFMAEKLKQSHREEVKSQDTFIEELAGTRTQIWQIYSDILNTDDTNHTDNDSSPRLDQERNSHESKQIQTPPYNHQISLEDVKPGATNKRMKEETTNETVSPEKMKQERKIDQTANDATDRHRNMQTTVESIESKISMQNNKNNENNEENETREKPNNLDKEGIPTLANMRHISRINETQKLENVGVEIEKDVYTLKKDGHDHENTNETQRPSFTQQHLGEDAEPETPIEMTNQFKENCKEHEQFKAQEMSSPSGKKRKNEKNNIEQAKQADEMNANAPNDCPMIRAPQEHQNLAVEHRDMMELTETSNNKSSPTKDTNEMGRSNEVKRTSPTKNIERHNAPRTSTPLDTETPGDTDIEKYKDTHHATQNARNENNSVEMLKDGSRTDEQLVKNRNLIMHAYTYKENNLKPVTAEKKKSIIPQNDQAETENNQNVEQKHRTNIEKDYTCQNNELHPKSPTTENGNDKQLRTQISSPEQEETHLNTSENSAVIDARQDNQTAEHNDDVLENENNEQTDEHINAVNTAGREICSTSNGNDMTVINKESNEQDSKTDRPTKIHQHHKHTDNSNAHKKESKKPLEIDRTQLIRKEKSEKCSKVKPSKMISDKTVLDKEQSSKNNQSKSEKENRSCDRKPTDMNPYKYKVKAIKKGAHTKLDNTWDPSHPLFTKIQNRFKSDSKIPDSTQISRELKRMRQSRDTPTIRLNNELYAHLSESNIDLENIILNRRNIQKHSIKESKNESRTKKLYLQTGKTLTKKNPSEFRADDSDMTPRNALPTVSNRTKSKECDSDYETDLGEGYSGNSDHTGRTERLELRSEVQAERQESNRIENRESYDTDSKTSETPEGKGYRLRTYRQTKQPIGEKIFTAGQLSPKIFRKRKQSLESNTPYDSDISESERINRVSMAQSDLSNISSYREKRHSKQRKPKAMGAYEINIDEKQKRTQKRCSHEQKNGRQNGKSLERRTKYSNENHNDCPIKTEKEDGKDSAALSNSETVPISKGGGYIANKQNESSMSIAVQTVQSRKKFYEAEPNKKEFTRGHRIMKLFHEIQTIRQSKESCVSASNDVIDEGASGFILINYDETLTKTMSRHQTNKALNKFLFDEENYTGNQSKVTSFRRKMRALNALRQRVHAKF